MSLSLAQVVEAECSASSQIIQGNVEGAEINLRATWPDGGDLGLCFLSVKFY